MNENAYEITGKFSTYYVTPLDHERARIETKEPFKVNGLTVEFSRHATIKYYPDRTIDTTRDKTACVQFNYANGEYRPLQRSGTTEAATDKARSSVEEDINAVTLSLFQSADFVRNGIIQALMTANIHATDNAQRRREQAQKEIELAETYEREAATYDQRIDALQMSSASADELRAAVTEYDEYSDHRRARENYKNKMVSRNSHRYDAGEEPFMLAYSIMEGTKRSTIAPVNIFAEPERLNN